eukprot:12953716-Alexandrium_andersonii.AAC.1
MSQVPPPSTRFQSVFFGETSTAVAGGEMAQSASREGGEGNKRLPRVVISGLTDSGKQQTTEAH